MTCLGNTWWESRSELHGPDRYQVTFERKEAAEFSVSLVASHSGFEFFIRLSAPF